jgi:hypothetical protein
MDLKDNIIEFWGSCKIKSNLTLEEVANKISSSLFGGLAFTYGKHSIWEEIPSMYIEHSIMGGLVIVGGYGGDEGFVLSIQPYAEFGRYLYANNLKVRAVKIELDYHLYHLLKQGLSEFPEIEIIEP